MRLHFSQEQSHYFDLTEDIESTRIVKQLAEDACSAFVPQCGLAPGFISIVANDVASRFDELRDVHLREVPALEEMEHFSLDGIDYEAFNTSRGSGALCESLGYRTVRYPGHRDIVKMLVRDLRLGLPDRCLGCCYA
jgi:saccharopine dehydrogenase-like NADP-dependent oxidoreductase